MNFDFYGLPCQATANLRAQTTIIRFARCGHVNTMVVKSLNCSLKELRREMERQIVLPLPNGGSVLFCSAKHTDRQKWLGVK